ncbi:EamA family transporter [Sphingomonas sp. AP4-R1]|uniref:DMT family transporter n=1 Tax=Sphingomonas sp. AP4-R1 TaxID=2735134 RepID=UPI00149397D2|nr:EamA family transporter [Sphingomonas sp. AP4-R1]QJU58244.1 EamA family transporter [Sphingomonas sp. AP4-R1]
MGLPNQEIGGLKARGGWAQSRVLVLLAVGYQWFYNGANFVAFKVGGDAVNPLLLAALRFAIAALIILPFGLWRWHRRPAELSELANAAGLGVAMLVGSQSVAIIGTHLLPAGVASVFGSAAPIFLALFAGVALREPLGVRQVYGIGLGFFGLVLMAWFASDNGGFSLLGAGLTLAASACWAAGSLWARRLRLPADPVVALTTQLVAAAGVLVLGVGASGIAGRTGMTILPATALLALAFLIIASTLVGYAVFLAVNADVSPTIANTFNYASPVVALLLSAVLLGEYLNLSKLFAAGVALSGVALMVRGSPSRQEGHSQ